MASKATLATRAETLRAEREASFKTAVFPHYHEPIPQTQDAIIPLGVSLSNRTTSPEDFKIGKDYWAIFAVEQRLRECGIVGNHDRRTGRRLDYWKVDTDTRTVHAITPQDMEPLDYCEREQQTLMIGYVVASLAVDSPRAFEGISVEIDRVSAEIRLVEATR